MLLLPPPPPPRENALESDAACARHCAPLPPPPPPLPDRRPKRPALDCAKASAAEGEVGRWHGVCVCVGGGGGGDDRGTNARCNGSWVREEGLA